MRIAIGCDDLGFPLKGPLIGALEADGHVVLDLGAFSAAPADYPDYARVVGQAVLRGFAEAGVLVCGSGVGAAIAANKLPSVRAAFCPDVTTARQSREEEDANVLCLSASALSAKMAVEVTRAWVGAGFSGDESQLRRLAKIALLEAELASTGKEPRHSGVAERAVAPPGTKAGERAPAEPPSPARPVGPAAGGETSQAAPSSAGTPDTPASVATIAAAEESAAAAPPERRTADALRIPAVEETLRFLESQSFLDRLWTKDATLWTGDPDGIRNRLGWLTAPTLMRAPMVELKAFADEIRRLQFAQIVVLGMGGASLPAELWSLTFGSKLGFPDLVLLDSTDPATVKHTLERINLGRTLFLVSSKSGTTAETLALYAFFRQKVEALAPPKPGMQFVAITDAGTPLDVMARETGFRHTFLNPASIGGRYSALSFFGLVPAALIGVDIKSLLARARAMVEQCGNTVATPESPAVRLGATLAVLARAGRDKVTFVLSDKIRALGPWLEQLLAESLGKDGKGLVPVVDETPGSPAVYGDDRLFVALTLAGDRSRDAALDALADAGHPVIRLELADALDVGAELFRWELATATAGAILGVNPFDEPDVARAKDNTASLLAERKKTRRLPEWPADAEEDGIVLMTGTSGPKPASVAEALAAHLGQVRPGDYLAIQAYLEPSGEVSSRLGAIRGLLRDRLRIATTLAFGPRYLHSTGQLHKGGPPTGLFIQITGEDTDEVGIPGAGYDFSALKAAQALGDLQALSGDGRRVIRLHLLGKPAQASERLLQLVRTATRRL
jgi:RpiB/LacA/LacB family sugar-phosphate isomerase